MADALPQDEPSDDFKAGWDKALAVAAALIKPTKPLTDDADALDRVARTTSDLCAKSIGKLRGAYQFRHLKDAQ